MIKKVIPHFCIIISLLMITFYILDEFNPGMNFVGNEFFKILLLIYSIGVLVMAAFLIYDNTKKQ